MKKSFLFIAGLIALLAFSCTDESVIEQSGERLRITGNLATDSRITFVQGDGVIETHWKIGDSIALYTDGDAQNNLKYKAKISGKTTEFEQGGDIELQNVEGKTVYACYPFNFSYEGYHDTHSIPSTYNLYGSTLDTPFLYGEGKISNNQLNLSLKHYFSYLRLKVSVQEIKDLFARFLEQSGRGEESEYDLTKTYLKVRSSEDISLSQGTFNPRTHEVTYKITQDYFTLHLDNIDYSSDNTYTYMIPILPLSGGSSISAEVWFTRNGSGEQGPTFKKQFRKAA